VATIIEDAPWAGYNESSNSWEAYKALMHVDKLHDYLRENTMQAYTSNNGESFSRFFWTFFQQRLVFP
jgi:hypothetical protein